MFKRLVSEYVSDELKKGKCLAKIKKKLLQSGYKENDVDEVLRSFELREADLHTKEKKVFRTKTKVQVVLLIIVILALVNAVFFYSFFSDPNYVLVEETPTGLVMRSISEEELSDMQKGLNASHSVEGLLGIS